MPVSTGSENTASGAQALYSNTSGFDNTAVGVNALYSNASASNNTAVGHRALFNNTGISNTAVGIQAVYSNTGGGDNTGMGDQAVYGNLTGNNNTGMGRQALYANVSGDANSAFGFGADVTAGNLIASTAIGYNSRVDASYKVRVGGSTATSIGGAVGWSVFSDGRYKKQVQEDVSGLEFIKLLRPVTYIVDIPGIDNYYEKDSKPLELTESLKKARVETYQRAAKQRECGFIAQEVEQAAIKTGFAFSGVDKPANDKALYGLRYDEFVVPIVKALQQQQQIIESQDKKIELLLDEVKIMKEALKKLQLPADKN
jgi:hypothetical protein